LTQGADKKLRIVPIDHFGFKTLPKFGLPWSPYFSAPRSVRLHYLPVGTHHGVGFAINVTTPILLPALCLLYAKAEIAVDTIAFLPSCYPCP
jgi:hypothetical protein